MRIGDGSVQLTYCTNIHAGESWPEVRAVLGGVVSAVKRRVAPNAPFGVGLRLAARAAEELEASGELAELGRELAEAGLYVFTLNGFPYGTFHGARVKEAVYRPDWREPARGTYTRSLARILAALLPPGTDGSISTVPGCFRPRGESTGARAEIAAELLEVAAELVAIERERGRFIALALEPEPACLLETTAEAVAFFEGSLFAAEPLARFAALARVDARAAEATLRRHLGVCLDACHASVEFERPLDALRALAAAGIAVPKVQVSAGLVLERATPETLEAFRAFADDTYLHQVVVKSAGGLTRFLDLPEALAAAPSLPVDAEWRVHFHVPVFERSFAPFASTQLELEELLAAPELARHCRELEVETYTFDVLPARYRTSSVDEAIARELAWTESAVTRGAR